MDRFRAGDFEAATKLLEPLLTAEPADAVLSRMYGLSLVRVGSAAQGLPFLAQARRQAPDDPLGALWHGIGLHAAGHHDEAAAALRAAAELAPAEPAPLIHLSRVLLRQDRIPEARTAARRAADLDPSLGEAAYAVALTELAAARATPDASPAGLAFAWLAFGRVCLRLDRVAEARTAFGEALAGRAAPPEAEAEAALLDHLCGQPLTALVRLQTLVERHPECQAARLGLASRLLLDGEPASALALLDQAPPPAADPRRPYWQAHRVQALVALGRDGAAAPPLAEAWRAGVPELELPLTWQRCLLARRSGDPDAAPLAERVAVLSRRRGSGTLEQRIDAEFDLAELREAQGRLADGFEHRRRGHGLLRLAQPFSRADHVNYLAAITGCFDAARLAAGPRSTNTDPTPVFIVGLPRTGTTLLEQILDAHPQVHGAGERLSVRETLSRLTGSTRAETAIAAAAALDEPTFTAASGRFLGELRALAPSASYVLDKMPDNAFHLGFIATLLPGARVICCTRDLRDVGASIFRHRFIGHHPYAHDLADLGWYMARHRHLMAHWRTCLPLPLLTIDHGDWIGDFEATLRRVLSFLGLPYDPACERFFERNRKIGTASRDQVRRPINAESVGRWRDHAEQLAPMLRELST